MMPTSGHRLEIAARKMIVGLLALLSAAVLGGCGGGSDDPPAPAVTSITVSAAPANAETGTTHQFSATARDQSGNTMTGVTFTWSSNDTNVATISSGGLASGVAAGTANITASAQGVTSGAVAFSVVQATAVTGTAATGAAIANATITLKDSQGNARTAVTGADGTFSVRTTGLIPPYLLQVQPAGGAALYSVSADASASAIMNVTPLTDLIIRSWYGVQNVALDTAFGDPAANAPPSPAVVEIISGVVLQVVKLWLDDAGVDTSTFNPISTPFTANGTGVDHVLDQTTVNTGTGTITITDGTTTQESAVSYDTNAGAVSVQTTTTGVNGSSSSSGGTAVPVSSEEQSAVQGVNAVLAAFANTVNTKGAQLVANDLAPYLSDSLLEQGMDKALFAASTATDFRGLNVSFELRSIGNLDTTSGLVDATFDYTITQGGASQTETVQFSFKKVGSDWLMNGDQRIAEVDLHAEMRTDQGAFASSSAPAINVHVSAPQGMLTGTTISGGGLWSNTALQAGPTGVREVEPTPGTLQTIQLDQYFKNSGPLGTLIAAGTPFTVNLARSSGSPVTYEIQTNAFTTEPISITNLTGSTLADAQLGQPLQVSWTLPQTYAIANVQLIALVFTGSSADPASLQCEANGPILSAAATSATITIPDMCNGQPVMAVNLNLSVNGINGERNQVIYSFQ